MVLTRHIDVSIPTQLPRPCKRRANYLSEAAGKVLTPPPQSITMPKD